MNSQNFGPGDNRQLTVTEALADLPADEKKSTLQRWRDSLKKLAGATLPDLKTPGDGAARQSVLGVTQDQSGEVKPELSESWTCPECLTVVERQHGEDVVQEVCPTCGFAWSYGTQPDETRPINVLECPNCGLSFHVIGPVGEQLTNCPRCGLMIAVFEAYRAENARLWDNQVKDAADFMAAVLPPKMVKRRLAQALHALDTAIARLEEVRRHEIDTGQWPGKALNTMLEDLHTEEERLLAYSERRYKVKRSVLRAYR